MTEKDKKELRTMEVTGGVVLILYAPCQWVFFPYIAVVKAENGKFKEACAYVVGTRKAKHSDDTIIVINGNDYIDREILPLQHRASIGRDKWLKFPLNQDFKDFIKAEPTICKKVQYVEVYNIFGFKKFYLYDYLNRL